MRFNCSMRSIVLIATCFLAACDGGSDSETVFRDPVQNTPPTAAFSVSTNQGKEPLQNVQFDAAQSFDPNGTIVNYAWDFGDGASVSGPGEEAPVHSFVSAGSFTVVLTVTDNDGATNSNVASQVITVSPNQPPLASFDWAVDPDGLTVTFDAASSSDSDGAILDYAWNFAGLGVASGLFATYEFPAQGDFDVALTVFDDNGDPGTTTQTVSVPGPNLPPTASVETIPAVDMLSGNVIGISTLSVMFDAAASGDADGTLVQYDWDFGDGLFGTASVDPGTNDIDPNSIVGVDDGVNSGTGITAYHVYSTLSSSLSARSVPSSLTGSLAVGDIDQDGDVDFVAGNFAEPNHLFLNNGNVAAPFEDVRSIDIADEVGATNAVALEDLNSDGYLDLIVANGVINDLAGPAGAANRIYLWQEMSGAFGSGVDIASGDINASTALAFGDIDQDSDPEIVAIANIGAPARVYFLDNVGGFGAGIDATESLAGASIALGDLNGDGNLDLVIGILSGPNRLYLGDGPGSFSAGFDISTDSHDTVSLVLGDVDGDLDLDLVTGNLGLGEGEPNRLYLNTCDSNCTPGSNPFSGLEIGSDITDDRDMTSVVELVDVDGDGDLDLMAGNIAGPSRIYLNHSNIGPDLLFNATLAGVDCDTEPEGCDEVPVSSGDQFSTDEVGSLKSVDFDTNPDADADLLIGTLGGPTKALANVCSPDCMPDTNPYSSAPVVDIPTNDTTSVAVGDVNNDGAVDLIAGHFGDVNRLHLSSDGVSFALGSDIGADVDATSAVVLGDVDSDGDLDLIVGNTGDGNRLYPNVCDGTCSAGSQIFDLALNISSDLTNTADLALGDVDQDGDLDLVVGNGVIGAQPNRVYINSCDAGCSANANVFTGLVGLDIDILADIAITNSVALGDLDGDGDLDLVVGNEAAPSLVYVNTCAPACVINTSNFAVVDSVVLNAGSARAVVLGDLNNDSRLDLVIGYADQADRTYLNTTVSSDAISFVLGQEFGNPTDATFDVGLADINGDGYLDVVAAVDGVSQLYLNDGVGQFGVGTVVTGESSAVRAIETANVDDPANDRDIDVVFGGIGSPNRLHLNAGAHLAQLRVTDDDDASDTTPVSIVVLNNQPPQAVFFADTSGGMTVLFDGSASDDLDPRSATPPNNGIEMFSWDFGDGQTAAGPNAAIFANNYAAPGQYIVRLTVVDDGGVVSMTSGASDSVSLTVNVENNLPIAMFTATPASGTAPLLVNFDANASFDSDGSIVQYDWDFGDGQFGSGITPSNTFANAGTYDVVLTVTDNIGDTADSMQTITAN